MPGLHGKRGASQGEVRAVRSGGVLGRLQRQRRQLGRGSLYACRGHMLAALSSARQAIFGCIWHEKFRGERRLAPRFPAGLGWIAEGRESGRPRLNADGGRQPLEWQS